MEYVKLLAVCLVLSSCAQTGGVQKLGPDTFNISAHAAPIRGGESGAKNIALSKANDYCSKLNKEILVININTKPSSHLPGGSANINFRCLNKDDSGLFRPEYKSTPDVTVEIQD